MGVAAGVCYLLELLSREATTVEFERPVIEARAAGAPAADVELLENAKRIALGVRDQVAAHRRREAELSAFVEVVRGERPNPCDGREALQALRIAEACEISRREHRPVALAEIPGGFAAGAR